MQPLSENHTYPYTIGIISDTHGIVPPAVLRLFQNVDMIIHAGDLDHSQVLEKLTRLAPVKAVKGNMDQGSWTEVLPVFEVIRVAQQTIGVLHDLQMLDLNAVGADLQVIISGHTHQAAIQRQNGILYLNPGSAAQPRYGQPPSVAQLTLQDGQFQARIISLLS